jgi:hypothetical protein
MIAEVPGKIVCGSRCTGPVGSHLRGDRFYGEIAGHGYKLTVRPEIGPYRPCAGGGSL